LGEKSSKDNICLIFGEKFLYLKLKKVDKIHPFKMFLG
jgi:hypothetical protein